MKQPVSPSNTKALESGPAPYAVHKTQSAGAPSGHLSQLAAMVNRSARVQTQLDLAADLQGSSKVETQRGLASEINAAPVVQAAGTNGAGRRGPIQGLFYKNGKKMAKKLKDIIASKEWNTKEAKEAFIAAATDDEKHDWEEWFAENLVNMKDDDVDSIYGILPAEDEESGYWEEEEEELPENLLNERANVEKQIRTAAVKITRPDHSGHGNGKFIPSGFKGDKHQVGQNRKMKRKKALEGGLEDLLELYVALGGDGTTLDPSTKKLLKKAGWKVPKAD